MTNLEDLQKELRELDQQDHAEMRRIRDEFELHKIQTKYEIDRLKEKNNSLNTVIGFAGIVTIALTLTSLMAIFF